VATFVLIHGAGDVGWYWHLVEAELQARGHRTVNRPAALPPPAFLRRVAQERLGLTPDEIDGGHTPALSRPHELADRLEAYAAGQGLLTDRQE
jgi:hypothetical protein